MTAASAFTLNADYGPIPINGSKGYLLVGNQSAAFPPAVVTVELSPLTAPKDVITLSDVGAQVSCATDELASVTIKASAYPTNILLVLSFSGIFDMASPGPAVKSGVVTSVLSLIAAGPATVGLAETHFPAKPLQQSIAVRADPANTGTILVGFVSGGEDWPLAAGESLSIDYSGDFWLVATAAGQTVHLMQGQ